MTVIVIDVHKPSLQRLGYTGLQDWLDRPPAGELHVYIGREVRYCPAAVRSVLANDNYCATDADRPESIRRYEADLQARPDALREIARLKTLASDGTVIILGCWCCPKACHGDVLARLIGGSPSPGPSVVCFDQRAPF